MLVCAVIRMLVLLMVELPGVLGLLRLLSSAGASGRARDSSCGSELLCCTILYHSGRVRDSSRGSELLYCPTAAGHVMAVVVVSTLR